jgi:hypothetical protein
LFKDLTTKHIAQSAGIPSFVLQLLGDKIPDGDDPVFFWNIHTEDQRVHVDFALFHLPTNSGAD